MEYARSLGELIFAIPRSNNVLNARIEPRLSQTDEEPQDVHLRGRCAFAHQDCEDGPCDFTRRDPNGRANLREEHIAWNFANHISNGPACSHDVQLVSVETHVLLHSRYVCIANIDLYLKINNKISDHLIFRD